MEGRACMHSATDATDATHACNGSRGARGSPPPLTSSRCCSYTADMSAAVGGSVLLTKMKMALSEGMVMRFRMTYTNWPTVKSIGMRYLRLSTCAAIGETGVGERGVRISGGWACAMPRKKGTHAPAAVDDANRQSATREVGWRLAL